MHPARHLQKVTQVKPSGGLAVKHELKMTRTARGRITLVQEQRFRLATDAGPSYLLVLAHDASQDAADLRRLLEAGTPVAVEYTGEPGLDSGVAHNIKEAKAC
jgi:hypothetical protein